jgi:hypothetical protein
MCEALMVEIGVGEQLHETDLENIALAISILYRRAAETWPGKDVSMVKSRMEMGLFRVELQPRPSLDDLKTDLDRFVA